MDAPIPMGVTSRDERGIGPTLVGAARLAFRGVSRLTGRPRRLVPEAFEPVLSDRTIDLGRQVNEALGGLHAGQGADFIKDLIENRR